MEKKTAALLNFTGDSYHWGCYGTAYEIYETLIEKGYNVNTLDVQTTHHARPTPQGPDDFFRKELALDFLNRNPHIYTRLKYADVVVVNGEGTLHRRSNGAMNLLFLMTISKHFLGKKVHLINHSLFPSGSDSVDDDVELIYKKTIGALDVVIPRETRSAKTYDRLKVGYRQGFDCLPRYIDRHRLIGSATREAGILLAGGVSMKQESLLLLAKIVNQFKSDAVPVRFLMGAKYDPAPEDARQFEVLKSFIPDLVMVNAKSMRAWLETISGSACLISGRFHHSIAAASLGTPFLAFPSNTPKIQAISDMLEYDARIDVTTQEGLEDVQDFIDRSLSRQSEVVRADRIKAVLELAKLNFLGL